MSVIARLTYILAILDADANERPDQDDGDEGHDRVEPDLAQEGELEARPQTQVLQEQSIKSNALQTTKYAPILYLLSHIR